MAKATVPREHWIAEALRALATGGLNAVRVEVLAKTLGVTKGSFYWHFTDRAALLEAVLIAWEQQYVDNVIGQVETAGGDGRARLRDLNALAEDAASDLIPLDLAVRDWARRDPAVRERLTRVDSRRMDYLRSLFAEFTDAADAEARSLLAFSMWIGQPQIAAEHGGRSRRDVARSALEFVLR